MSTSVLTELVRRHPRLASKILPETELLRTVNRQTGKKENLLALAEFLAKCRELEKALETCEVVFKESPSEQVIAVAVGAVSGNVANAQQFKRVEGWLKAARVQKPELVDWDIHLAILKERQAAYVEAEDLYRSVLKRAPKNLVAVNNLAFLVGLQGKRNEAVTLIEKAITAVGPVGELLDSRAAILRANGNVPDAEKAILQALKLEKTPYRLFHKAQIQHSAGKAKESRGSFGEAVRIGLAIEMLHPLEFESYQKLLKEFEAAN